MPGREIASGMRLEASIDNSPLQIQQDQLLLAMDTSQIHTFGWPIGVVMHNSPFDPKPMSDGIETEVDDAELYDYWTVKKDGRFSYTGSYFEDRRRPGEIFIDTRTNRVAESIWRVGRLYTILKADPKSRVEMKIEHFGLKNRVLGVGNPARIMMPIVRRCHEERVGTSISFILGDLLPEYNRVSAEKLEALVTPVILDLALLFDFFKPSGDFVSGIVKAFIGGKII